MDSCQLLVKNRNLQVRDSTSSCSSNTLHGFSTSQMHLHKILGIIASYPPPPPEILKQLEEKKEGSCCGYKGLGIDLNMESASWEVETDQDQSGQSGSLRSDCSGIIEVFCNDSMAEVSDCVDGGDGGFVGKKSSSEGECDPPGIQEIGEESGSVNLQTIKKETNTNSIDEQSKQVREENDNKEQEGDGGAKAAPCNQEQNHVANDCCLSLLIEAAEIVSSEESSDKVVGNDGGGGGVSEASKSPLVEELCGDIKDASPVIRSKRGRSQTLPRRYRDSILLEPWKRLRLQPKSAGAATTAAVSRKRRSR